HRFVYSLNFIAIVSSKCGKYTPFYFEIHQMIKKYHRIVSIQFQGTCNSVRTNSFSFSSLNLSIKELKASFNCFSFHFIESSLSNSAHLPWANLSSFLSDSLLIKLLKTLSINNIIIKIYMKSLDQILEDIAIYPLTILKHYPNISFNLFYSIVFSKFDGKKYTQQQFLFGASQYQIIFLIFDKKDFFQTIKKKDFLF
ncbi:hypothetical protein RFI_37167, partial [Reticulomyxa filosa]